MTSMNRVLVPLALALFIAGCGNSPGDFTSAEAREICETFVPGVFFDITVTTVEADRSSGTSKSDEISAAIAGCQAGPTPEIQVSCVACSIAIIDFVYGD